MVQTIDQVRRNNDVTMIVLLVSQVFFYSILFLLLWGIIRSYQQSRKGLTGKDSQTIKGLYNGYVLVATISAFVVVMSGGLLFSRFFLKPNWKGSFWKTSGWKFRRFAADFFDFTGPSMALLVGMEVVNVSVLFMLLAFAYVNSSGSGSRTGLSTYFRNTDNLPLVSLGATLSGFVLGVAKLSGTREYQVLYKNPLTRSTGSWAWEKTKRGGKYGYRKAEDLAKGTWNLAGTVAGGVYNAAGAAVDVVRGRFQA